MIMRVLIFLLLVSCSQVEVNKNQNSLCPETNQKIEDRHIVISIKSKVSSLAHCFKNYLKFEKNKKQSFKVCNVFSIAKNGTVTYSKAFGLGKRIPKDFKMCLEQEFWMMNFAKLQLKRPANIKFPLEFKSK